MSAIDEDSNTLRARARLRLLRQWWQREYVAEIDHEDVVGQVRGEGRLTSRYVFMITMSCAIAILGLLLSSPAVVIGAMLISPLMAPIMSLGFSLCVLDLQQMRKALEGLVVGVITALAISFVIVRLSPLSDVTPEILARTQPNFFDLLVAIFSGLAGGYAVIKRKGEAIVGVAIATALMPPLAVVGFGLATESAAIAQGAFMLFMTNLLAISLSVTLLAKFYGFSSGQGRIHTLWQILLIGFVFVVLSLPLGVALKNIAYQSYVTKTARSTILSYFGEDKARLSLFKINFNRTEGPVIDAVVLTSNYRDKAKTELTALLSEQASGTFGLMLDQIVVAHEVIAAEAVAPVADNTLVPTQAVQLAVRSRGEDMANALKQATFFPTDFIRVDADERRGEIYPKPAKGVGLTTLRQFEESLKTRYPGWTITVHPPVQALPAIAFDTGGVEPNEAGLDKLGDIIWALSRWSIHKVDVVGYASTKGELERFDNTSLAYRRAMSVAAMLETVQIQSEQRAEYRSFRQREAEQNFGVTSFQRVVVRPLAVEDD